MRQVELRSAPPLPFSQATSSSITHVISSHEHEHSVLGLGGRPTRRRREVAEVEAQLLEEDEREHRVRRESDARRHEALEEAERTRLEDLNAHREQTLRAS